MISRFDIARVWRVGALLGCLSVGFPAVAPVQGQAQAQTQTSVPVPSADPFARYYTPNQCTMHAARAEQQYWRDQRPDTVLRAPWGNPLRPNTIAEVRQCLSRFTVASVPVRDLLFLGRGYVISNQPARADSAFQRLLAAKSGATVEQRGWLLAQMVMAYGEATPAQLAGVARYMAELDKLPADAAPSQTLAHVVMARVANYADSVAMFGVEAMAAVAAARRLQGEQREQRAFDELTTRYALADWYMRRGVYDSAHVVARGFVADLSGRRMLRGLGEIAKVYDLAGAKGPPLEYTWSFNNPDSLTFPVAGKPTLIVFASGGSGPDAYDAYAAIRRFVQKYRASGLNVVMSNITYGYYRNKLVPASEEAAGNARFFMEYLKLPVIVAIHNAKYTIAPWGTRINVFPPGFDTYRRSWWIPGTPAAVLVGRDGIIRFVGTLGEESELRYDRMIAEMK